MPNGPPQMTRITLPACRAHYPGGSRRVLVSVASPSRAAFPESQAGRHPRRHFRGLLRLHSRYGPLDRSTAQRRPLSQGFGAAGYPATSLASYQTKPTTLWVEPSSTGDARRLGALRNRCQSLTFCSAATPRSSCFCPWSASGREPPHDAVRRRGRADLRRVVRRVLGRPLPDLRLHPIQASPRRDLLAGAIDGVAGRLRRR